MTILLLLFAIVPCDHFTTDRAAVIECNHFHDPHTGRIVLTQWIFWEENPVAEPDEMYRVLDWRMVKPGTFHLTRHGNRFRLLLRDGKHWRTIDAPVHRETWTLTDPEVEDRKRWSKDKRRGLSCERQ